MKFFRKVKIINEQEGYIYLFKIIDNKNINPLARISVITYNNMI